MLKQRTLPSGAKSWRARYDDPDTGREVYVTLDPVALPTHEARKLWAQRKAKEIARRAMELELGAPPVEARDLEEAIDEYLKAAEHRLRGKTLTTYRQAVGLLQDWAKRSGVGNTSQLTRSKLSAFRDHLVAQPRRAAKRGGARGARKETDRKRSPVSINRELRAIKTLLNSWRVAGRLPHLDRDAIADTLKALAVPRNLAEYLQPAQLQKLLRAAERHDAAVFDETRKEHAGLRPRGTTKRYAPIAPFVVFLLLTGCRRGEALSLRWSDVDLEAVDHTGQRVGEIRLRSEETKTHQARSIGLEVSPALRQLLARMKVQAQAAAGTNVRIDQDHVFRGKEEPYSADLVDAARDRLRKTYGSGKFDWQLLRSTCATYLTNSPGIFGAASVYMSARQLGHSVAVAEKHYLGVHRGIPRDARSLEQAMQVEAELRSLLTDPKTSPSSVVTPISA